MAKTTTKSVVEGTRHQLVLHRKQGEIESDKCGFVGQFSVRRVSVGLACSNVMDYNRFDILKND